MNALAHQQQWDAFLNKELPTRRDERWKYTDLAFLANKKFLTAQRTDPEYLHAQINQYRLQHGESILLVFINGHFMPTLSDINKLSDGVIACSLQDALAKHADLVKQYWHQTNDTKKYPFANMNAALHTDGLFLYVPDKCELETPVHLLSLASGDSEFIAHPHHLITLGSQSKLTLIEEYAALSIKSYMMNIVTDITVGNDARLEYIKIQTEGEHGVHMANTFVDQKQNSSVTVTNFSSGGMFARDDLVVKLMGTGADCRTSGFYHLQRDNQYIDHHVDITHNAPRSHSEMLYKGILNKKSRAVFNGRVCVAKDAQKIVAQQANHNLLLSHDAEVYSKPELEIYADDVKCKHGATTGQLDQDALFYMRARGIELSEAMTILLQGFAEEITQRVTHLGIKQHVQEGIL